MFFFREDIDAPDLTLIDFNTVARVQYRSLEPAIIDPVEVVKDKDAFRRYMHRELKYWRVSCCFNVNKVLQGFMNETP